jgi:hypothetical protein
LKRPDKKRTSAWDISLTKNVVLSNFDPFLEHLNTIFVKKQTLNEKIGRLFAPEWMY